MSTIPSSAIVIGAGFSGIAASLILAKHGCKVTLVERAHRPGLTLRGFFRRGVHFDSGLHYVGEMHEQGILRAYLRYLGLDDLPLSDFDRDVFETYRFTDGSTFTLPVGWQAMAERLSDDFPGERAGIEAYFREARIAFDASRFHTFRGTFQDAGEKDPRWAVTLESVLDRHFRDMRLRNMLASPAWLYGVSPREVTFLMHARVAGSYFHSIKNFTGGGHTLIKACEKRLDEEGVTLLCNSLVNRILFSPASRISGVELESGERLAGEAVIFTGHPSRLPDMLPDNVLRPILENRLRTLHDSISAYLLFFRTESCPEVLRNRNLLVFPHDEPFAEAFKPGRSPVKGPFYLLANPFAQTVSPSPEGNGGEDVPALDREARSFVGLVLSDSREYAPFFGSRRGQRPTAYNALKQERISQITEQLFKSCPDVAHLELVESATPLTAHDWLFAPRGGLYGSAHDISQYNPLPPVKIPNLYLSGQATVSPGFMGAAIAAFLTCGFIVGHEPLLNEVRACKRDG